MKRDKYSVRWSIPADDERCRRRLLCSIVDSRRPIFEVCADTAIDIFVVGARLQFRIDMFLGPISGSLCDFSSKSGFGRAIDIRVAADNLASDVTVTNV